MPHIPIKDFRQIMADNRAGESALLDKMENYRANREAHLSFAEYEIDYDEMLEEADRRLSLMMVSCNRDISLRLLKFIVESKKSTRPYRMKELDLLLMYIRHNLREELPSNGLIEKALKRLNDSYNKLLRVYTRSQTQEFSHEDYEIPPQNVHLYVRLYEIFIQHLHNLCIYNVYHGAVMIRKKNSLKILLMINTIVKTPVNKWIWTKNKFAVILDCIKWDNYDTIKNLAYEVIKSSNYINKYFCVNDDKFYIEMRKALMLANRRMPISVIGAAFLLKTLILSEPTEKYFSNNVSMENVSVVERNAYLVVQNLKDTFKKNVSVASDNIMNGVSQSCLYGHIQCILSILETINLRSLSNCELWKKLISEIIELCLKLNEAVFPIVKNISPEGYLPIDAFEETVDKFNYERTDPDRVRRENIQKGFLNENDDDGSETDYDIKPRMLLLCSWRSVVNTSLFFAHLISNADIEDEQQKGYLLSQQQALTMANNLFHLVRESKHRGAFEVCSVAFEKACNRFWRLPASHDLHQLPKKWLQSIMLDILELSSSDRERLCATRRSAGVPFMIQAILTSEIRKNCDEKNLLFHKIMKLLLKIILIGNRVGLDDKKSIVQGESLFTDCSLDRIDEPFQDLGQIRTHALFVLRALYKHAKLGDLVKEYVELGFFAAFNSYTADNWAEQNAATMLFSALISRVFGVQLTKDHINVDMKNRMTVDQFMLDFPNLILYILRELSTISHEPSSKLQSLLLLVSRIYPKKFLNDTYIDQTLHKLFAYVQRCGGNKCFQTRELAARTVVALMIPEDVAIVVPNLFVRIMGEPLSLNATHGYLLQLIEIFGCPEFKIERIDARLIKAFIFYVHDRLFVGINAEEEEEKDDTRKQQRRQPCYALCHAATKLLRKIYESSTEPNKIWLITMPEYLDLVNLATRQLIQKVKPGPYLELYQTEVIRLALAPIEHPEYKLEIIKGQDDDTLAATYWLRLLEHDNVDVVELAWIHLSVVLRHNGRSFAATAMGQTMHSITNPQSMDIKLQGQMFKQASSIIESYEALSTKHDFIGKNADYANRMGVNPPFVDTFCAVVEHTKDKTFRASCGYLLFLHVFHRDIVRLNHGHMGVEDLLLDRKETMYRYFKDLSTYGSRVEFREIISQLMFDPVLFTELDTSYYNYAETAFCWWTILLNLLFDEKPSIRDNARNVVRTFFKWRDRFYCESVILEQFFHAFCASFMPHKPQLAVAFMFIWTMNAVPYSTTDTFESDDHYTGDNYEALEPMLISELCAERIRKMSSLENDDKLTEDIKEILVQELHLGDLLEFYTLRDFFTEWELLKYEDEPAVFNRLNHHVRPGCPSEHMRRVAYKNLRDAYQYAANWERPPKHALDTLGYDWHARDDEFFNDEDDDNDKDKKKTELIVEISADDDTEEDTEEEEADVEELD